MPYKGETIIAVFNKIKASGKKVLEKTGDSNLDDLIGKLLETNPKKRISWKDYFEHKFFKC